LLIRLSQDERERRIGMRRTGSSVFTQDGPAVGRRGQLMAAAAGMVVRDAFISARRKFVLVPFEMTLGSSAHRNAIEALSRMRESACPQHEDEHQRSDQGLPASHQRHP